MNCRFSMFSSAATWYVDDVTEFTACLVMIAAQYAGTHALKRIPQIPGWIHNT